MTNQSDNKTWQRWVDSPPCLREPILLSYGDCREITVMMTAEELAVCCRGLRTDPDLYWTPSGIYREEQFRCSGRWV